MSIIEAYTKSVSINTKDIDKNALELIRLLNNEGYEAYLVGGCVRDMLLRYKPKDYDICTNALPEDTLRILKKNKIRYHKLGIKFGTVVAMIGTNEYEITTYRIDGQYSDSRRPDEVEFTTNILKDLSRRDLTINAIALDINNNTLIDPFDGLFDIKARALKAVGDPDKRFEEDALRILRVLRFAIKYDLGIEHKTYNAMVKNKKLLQDISKERITSELMSILSLNVSIQNQFTNCSWLIKEIIPELGPTMGFDQHNKYHNHNVYEHILNVVDNCNTTKPEVKLAALLHDIGKPKAFFIGEDGQGHFYGHPEISYNIAAEVVKNRLKLSKAQEDKILTLVRYHDLPVGTSKASAKRLIVKLGEDNVDDWMIHRVADMKDHEYYDKKEEVYSNIEKLRENIRIIREENECFSLKNLKHFPFI